MTEQAEGGRKQAGHPSKHANGQSRTGALLLTAMLEADLAEWQGVLNLSSQGDPRSFSTRAERCKERACQLSRSWLRAQGSSDWDQCSNLAKCKGKVPLHEIDHQPRR